MNIKEAINYIKNSENFVPRFIPFIGIMLIVYVGGALVKSHMQTLIPVYIIALMVIKYFLIFLAFGYQVITQRNYMLCKPEFIPSFTKDFLPLLKSGFKYYAALFLYTIPFVFYFGIWLVIAKPFPFNPSNIYSQESIVIFIIGIIISSTILYFYPALLIMFSTKFKFLEMFNFKKACEIIKTVPKAYLKAFAVNILLVLPVFILDYIFKSNPIALVVLNGFTTPILTLIWSIYFGDIYRKFIEIQILPEENTLV